MKRLLLGFFAVLLSATTALAAAGDNQLVITPGVGVTFRCKDTNGAGLQSCLSIPGDANGNIAWGTAGTANANVMSVQGIAAMTPFLVNPGTPASWGISATGAAVPANAILNGMSQGGNNTALTGTAGNLNVNVAAAITAGANIIGKVGIDQTTPGTTNAIALGQIGSTTTAAGNGVAGAGVLRVAVASDNTAFGVNAAPTSAPAWGINTLGSTTSGQSGQLALGAVTTAAPSYTTAQTNALSLDTSGGLRVSIIAGGGSGGTASTFGAAFPATGTAAGFTDGTNMVAGRVTTYGTAPTGFNALATNSFVTNANANGQATMANSSPVVLASNQAVGDPCTFQTKTNVPISTASGTTQLVAAVSAKKIYVCSVLVVAPSAVSVSLSEGSSGTCGTSAQAAVIGVATNGTAANGVALAANGGFAYGGGDGTVAQTATANNTLCLFQSGTAQLAGNLSYVQQ